MDSLDRDEYKTGSSTINLFNLTIRSGQTGYNLDVFNILLTKIIFKFIDSECRSSIWDNTR